MDMTPNFFGNNKGGILKFRNFRSFRFWDQQQTYLLGVPDYLTNYLLDKFPNSLSLLIIVIDCF